MTTFYKEYLQKIFDPFGLILSTFAENRNFPQNFVPTTFVF